MHELADMPLAKPEFIVRIAEGGKPMDPKQPLGVVVFVRYREAWYSLSEEQQRAWRKPG